MIQILIIGLHVRVFVYQCKWAESFKNLCICLYKQFYSTCTVQVFFLTNLQMQLQLRKWFADAAFIVL